jgi:arginine exporter protein ArgO
MKKFQIIILIVILISLTNLIYFLYNAFLFSFIHDTIQYFIVPIVLTPYIINDIQKKMNIVGWRSGGISGILLTFFPTSATAIVQIIQHFINGKTELDNFVKIGTLPNTTDLNTLILFNIMAVIFSWIVFILLGALCGIFSGNFLRRKN